MAYNKFFSAQGNEPYQALQGRMSDMDLDFRFIFSALRNRILLIIFMCALAIIAGFGYIKTQIPQYRATALLQLNTQDQIMLDMDTLRVGRLDDTAVVNSDIDIIRSRTVAQRVIENLELISHPDFAVEDTDDEERARIKVADEFAKRLGVRRDPTSYTVSVSFTAPNPRDAQEIVNTLAEEYLNYKIENQYETARRANEWLTGRVEELRKQVIESESTIQSFSEEKNLFETDGVSLKDRQLSDLNRQLAAARQDLARIEARAQQVAEMRRLGLGTSSLPEVLGSPLVQRLREQEAQMVREKSQLSSQYGPRHPQTANINQQIEELQSKIYGEIGRITRSIENEVGIARQRVSNLTVQLDSLQQATGDQKLDTIQLEDLKREAQANRELYESFLTRLKESGEAQNLNQINAKIIHRADLPLEPTEPKKSFILALAAMAGLAAGLAIAFLLEHMNRGFLVPGEIEEYLGVQSIGMVPEASKKQILSDYAARHPSSAHAEALRSIMASLEFSQEGAPAKTVLIISSLPEEGKGWLSTSLSRIIAKSGKKVLLIDCDMHKQMSLSLPGAEEALKTLNDYLGDRATMEEIIQQEEGSQTFYIGSSNESRNLQELLQSERMQHLMKYAKQNFDMVIVDSPPVIGMSDVLFLSRLVDTTILAVRWMKTPRHVVVNALRTLSRARIDLTGIILTRVDFGQYKKYEFGASKYYKKYNTYYNLKDKNLDDDNNKPIKIAGLS